tara:strand:- start:10799 stop:11044 length:246 start_codon:yes stop_codon:yes gene_type:complete
MGAFVGITICLHLVSLEKLVEYVMRKKYNFIFISTPDGNLIKAFYNFKNKTIQSFTRGGVAKLRLFQWLIEKRNKKEINNK